MEMVRLNLKRFYVFFLICFFLLTVSGTAAASGKNYTTSYENSCIKITSPGQSETAFHDFVIIEGETELDEVWFCIRGPEGEIATHFTDAKNGKFNTKVFLRFGQGVYTFWAGDNSTRFDGSIRFEIENLSNADTRYISPSVYIDNEDPVVADTVRTIVQPDMSDMDKLRAIHGWVTKNITYDYDAFINGNNTMYKASETIIRQKGVCRDYSFVVAALARAAKLESRVVYGKVFGSDAWKDQLH
jgi:hypothetical protein